MYAGTGKKCAGGPEDVGNGFENVDSGKERITVMLHKCTRCGGSTEIRTYREFIICPYCKTKDTFPGFEYKHIEWRDSMYAGVKHWMDCPDCGTCLNVQKGFTTQTGRWICTECRYENDVTEENII